MRSVFRFPNPVNETSARLVATGVALECIAFLVLRQGWLLIPLAYGFIARVAAGPTFSPLGQLVTRFVTPQLTKPPFSGAHRFVPGPPKRFAQGIGATLSAGALVVWGFGGETVAIVLVTAITFAATLEAVWAYCLGCVVFNRLMKWGIVPDDVCEACNDFRSLSPAVGSPAVATGQVSGHVSGQATS